MWKCFNCNKPFGLDFEADGPKCPSCGLTVPAVVPATHNHWLRAVEGGPIIGWGGRTYAVACRPQRQNLLGISATGDPSAVSCPECKKLPAYEESLEAYLGGV